MNFDFTLFLVACYKVDTEYIIQMMTRDDAIRWNWIIKDREGFYCFNPSKKSTARLYGFDILQEAIHFAKVEEMSASAVYDMVYFVNNVSKYVVTMITSEDGNSVFIIILNGMQAAKKGLVTIGSHGALTWNKESEYKGVVWMFDCYTDASAFVDTLKNPISHGKQDVYITY